MFSQHKISKDQHYIGINIYKLQLNMGVGTDCYNSRYVNMHARALSWNVRFLGLPSQRIYHYALSTKSPNDYVGGAQ